MRLLFFRHALTRENIERRYMGRNDAPLCAEGYAQLQNIRIEGDWPEIIVSPMLRCRQTAEMLFPGREYAVCRDLRECDFGDFSDKTADMLMDNPAYRKWIDGEAPPPGGESREDFCARCQAAFLDIVSKSPGDKAFVLHGGSIRAILEGFALPRRGFFDTRIPNAGSIACDFDGNALYLRE